MFHWSKKGLYVVLSDREELDLLARVSDGPIDRARYHFSRTARKRLERKMLAHLDECFQGNPAEFHRLYVERRCEGPSAAEHLEVLLEGYARVVRCAFWEDSARLREIPDALPLSSELRSVNDVCNIVIMKPPWWSRLPVRKLARLTIPIESIQLVTGTSQRFNLVTKSLHAEFGPGGVTVIAHNSADSSLTIG